MSWKDHRKRGGYGVKKKQNIGSVSSYREGALPRSKMGQMGQNTEGGRGGETKGGETERKIEQGHKTISYKAERSGTINEKYLGGK